MAAFVIGECPPMDTHCAIRGRLGLQIGELSMEGFEVLDV
jgi:hypothetical protein